MKLKTEETKRKINVQFFEKIKNSEISSRLIKEKKKKKLYQLPLSAIKERISLQTLKTLKE